MIEAKESSRPGGLFLGRRALLAALVLLLAAACVRMDGPEAAARDRFSEWAVNIRSPYRHERFETLSDDGSQARVRITVELKVQGEWTQKQTEVDCEMKDETWECGGALKFK